MRKVISLDLEAFYRAWNDEIASPDFVALEGVISKAKSQAADRLVDAIRKDETLRKQAIQFLAAKMNDPRDRYSVGLILRILDRSVQSLLQPGDPPTGLNVVTLKDRVRRILL